MRSISRVADGVDRYVAKLLVDAVQVCAALHDEKDLGLMIERVLLHGRKANERGGHEAAGRGRRRPVDGNHDQLRSFRVINSPFPPN